MAKTTDLNKTQKSSNSKNSNRDSVGGIVNGYGGSAGGLSSIHLGDTGIMNMPFQFNRIADSRMYGDWRGRTYTSSILDNTPVVMFRIGKPEFLEGGSKADKAGMKSLLENAAELAPDALDNLFNDSTHNQMYYYSFKDDFENYSKYVDAMVRYTSIEMGVKGYETFSLMQDTIFNGFGKNLGDSINCLKNIAMRSSKYVAFYCEASGTSSNEGGSNTTGDSQLANGVKTLGQTKREMDFLFGSSQTVNDNQADYDSFMQKALGGLANGVDGLINRFSGTFTSVASGANVLFPEIWQDSSFRAGYSLEFRFYSPYGDKESIFQNIYVPLFCLLAMALPRQSGKQGYTSPPLVQCWSKGWFTCNCGMVDSIDIKKGGSSGGEFNSSSLPTEITVTMSIKDLYPGIMSSALSSGIGSGMAFANNVGLTDYLRTLAGVQITEVASADKILEHVLSSIKGGIKDSILGTVSSTTTKLGSIPQNIVKSIFGGLSGIR